MEPGLLAAALVAYNSLLNRWPPFLGWAYVPANLAAAGAVLAAGLGPLGLGVRDIGLRWDSGGAVAGAALGAGLALPALAAALHPRLRRFVSDERVRGIRGWTLAYRVLVRIPIGTALFEELAFRGVLYGAWRPHGVVTAALGSAAAFGLWHVSPTLNLVTANQPDAGLRARLGAAAAAVALTAAAGVGFAALREATGSLAAPFALHAVLNSLATLAAVLAFRDDNGSDEGSPRPAGELPRS